MWHNFDRGRYWPSCTFLMTQLCNWRVSTWYWHFFPPIQGLLHKNAALSLVKWFRQRLVPSLPSRDWHSGQSEKKHNQGTTQCTRKTWNPQHYCTVEKDIQSHGMSWTSSYHRAGFGVVSLQIQCFLCFYFPVLPKPDFSETACLRHGAPRPAITRNTCCLKFVTSAGSNFDKTPKLFKSFPN